MTGSTIVNRLSVTAPWKYFNERMTQWMNQSLRKVFVEQHLASPGSAKYIQSTLIWKVSLFLYVKFKKNILQTNVDNQRHRTIICCNETLQVSSIVITFATIYNLLLLKFAHGMILYTFAKCLVIKYIYLPNFWKNWHTFRVSEWHTTVHVPCVMLPVFFFLFFLHILQNFAW